MSGDLCALRTVRQSSSAPDEVALPLWKAEEKWKAKGWVFGRRWGLPFAGQHDNEYVLRGMMWADNCRLFCDNREMLICMVNDIEELLDLDMEPNPESLWRTSTHKQEAMKTDTSSG